MENFSKDEEELLRAYIFTNPHGRTSFLYQQSLLGGEELAPLMAAVSRTHIPMQDRVLEFLDEEKKDETRKMLPIIKEEMEINRDVKTGSIKVSKKAENFNKKWVIKHGHNSIKEISNLIGYCEDISDISASYILGHSRNRPQAKSTRYISYGNVLDMILDDVDIKRLNHSDEFFEYLAYMNSQYLKTTEKLVNTIWNSEEGKAIREYKQKESIKVKGKPVSDDALIENLKRFVFDSARVYLPASTRTSLGFSVDSRSLEEIITRMISSEREEDKQRGYELWEEAKKISPVLLGEKSHIKEDKWIKYKETEFLNEMRNRFRDIPVAQYDKPEVKIISPKNVDIATDRFNAACALFPYLESPFISIYERLSNEDVKVVLEKIHENRGEYDNIDESIAHGGIIIEFVMGHHAYRDIFRHRKGARSTQLLSTNLGFEIPPVFEKYGLADEYKKDMMKAAEMYKKAAIQNPHIAEKLVPFGALRRAIHSWSIEQIAYVGRLRSDIIKGNYAYVHIIREMMEEANKLFPETMKYARWNKDDYPEYLWKDGYDWYDKKREENREGIEQDE
ncbi:MAG: hypothetical protein PWR30_327 [Candidatus Woesearchaeota archaeon]|nr:hypothetical protein [Candidatus Woesearchaeota archaeon]